MRNSVLILIILMTNIMVYGQAERSKIRKGNRFYNKADYTNAEVNYRDALAIDSTSVVATNNLASALYQQKQYASAREMFDKIVQLDTMVSSSQYNLGNAQLQGRAKDSKAVDMAIESYKRALRINPNDTQAKFNLAFAQALKPKGGNGGKDKKPEEKEQKEEKDKEKEKEKEQQQQQQDAERILKAIQAQEDKTKQEAEKRKIQQPKNQGGKQW